MPKLNTRRRQVTGQEGFELQDRVVSINRCVKVVKGGKNLSFSALVVVGNGRGIVGWGMGKAREVPSAISKGIEKAKASLIRVPMVGATIPHEVVGRFGAGTVVLKPAAEGTGIIAGGPVRALLEVAGVRDILSKCIGTNNPHNAVKATADGLLRLRHPSEVARLRGKETEELWGAPPKPSPAEQAETAAALAHAAVSARTE